MSIFHRFFLFFALGSFSLSATTLSITQAASGNTLEISPVKVTDSEVTFILAGEKYTVPLSSLKAESQKVLQDWKKAKAEKIAGGAADINQAIGHDLFGNAASIWDEDPDEVASRLRWRQESATDQSSSYRSYPRPDYGFANAHPYCCTLYGGKDDKVSHLSLVFANKGDYGSTVGQGEDHFKSEGELPDASSLNGAIKRDAKAISLVLTEALGDPTEQRYGEKEDRRNVKRWDFGDHAFILSEREDEYVHLLIVPAANADNEGKVDFVKDQDLRAIIAANVLREENGDVRIKNIPMVDQGPKGYCAPATFERAMRYMLVPADMYLLATLATAPGGGTYTGLLAEESKRIIRSKARRIKDLDLSKDLNMRVVSRYIDKGVPILWQMSSHPLYNKIANTRTEERAQVDDFSAWASDIAAEAEKSVPKLSNTINHHICMIVGYNVATNELAVSDSWGPSYELRWVHIDVAKAVTTSGGFVVDL